MSRRRHAARGAPELGAAGSDATDDKYAALRQAVKRSAPEGGRSFARLEDGDPRLLEPFLGLHDPLEGVDDVRLDAEEPAELGDRRALFFVVFAVGAGEDDRVVQDVPLEAPLRDRGDVVRELRVL